MTSKATIRLACVPEQVNIPVEMMKSLHIDAKYNIDVQVLTVPEGTGKMLDMLERGDADIAMTVSDAFIVANAKGRHVELVGTWVSSPLVWAVAASPMLPEDITTVPDLLKHRQTLTDDPNCKLRVGISRPGSGSQTMATYMAMLHQLNYVNGLEFVVANNFDGLKRGIETDQFDIFLWETFTTKPDFDSNVLRKLDDVRTPWPAFSLVMSSNASSRMLSEDYQRLHMAILKGLFPALAESAHTFISDADSAVQQIVASFGHQHMDARLWLHSVQYNISSSFVNRAPMDYADEHKGHLLHFKSTSFLTLQPIDIDLYANSVRILQSVGLVPLEFNVHSLWPSWSLFHPEATAANSAIIPEHILSIQIVPPREIETL